MTDKEFKILKLENRIAKLSESPKNFKCPGVVKALKRELNALQKSK